MARPSFDSRFNIAQLEQILSERRTTLAKLAKQRRKIVQELDQIDAKIARIGGNVDGAPRRTGVGSRPRNEKSLPATLEDVLRAAGKPMRVPEITEAVEAAGYRSTSDNFRAIINQTLIKERKRFVNTGERGTYALKK